MLHGWKCYISEGSSHHVTTVSHAPPNPSSLDHRNHEQGSLLQAKCQGKRQLKLEKYQYPNFIDAAMNAHCPPIPEKTSQTL